jgi:spermidine/putrescine transport system substrate-binding protein
LWNAKFDKKLLIKDAFRDVYSPLLIYANQERVKSGEVTLDELMHDATDESIAVVEALLKQAKPYVAGWEADFGKEIMTKEKAWLNLSWSGDAVWAIEEAEAVGVELDYVVPEEGSIVWFDGWVIPKYAKNTKAAAYFINFMCMPENAIRNMDEIGYVSVIGTPDVMEYMSESAVEAGVEHTTDLTYFFGEEADSVVINSAMYPDRKVIERCAMMHDSGPRTEAMLAMWSRVKGDNLNNWMVVVIFIAIGFLIVVGVIRKLKKRRQRRRRW